MAGPCRVIHVIAMAALTSLLGCSPTIDVESMPRELAEPAAAREVEAGSTEVPPAIRSRVDTPELLRTSVDVEEAPNSVPTQSQEPEPELPLEQLARERAELRNDIDQFLIDLEGPLQDKELVEIRALYAVHDMGQFLDELDIWLEVPGRKQLVGRAHLQRLQVLHERWNAFLIIKSRVLHQLEELK